MVSRREWLTTGTLAAGAAVLSSRVAQAAPRVKRAGWEQSYSGSPEPTTALEPGRGYTPVITPNNGSLPYKVVDGAKVYIQFPSGLAQSEAPPLFVIGPDAKPALVNYRVRGTTYIVDRLFAAAELRLGTAPQRVVRIVRTDAVWREVTQ